jgi:nitrogen regulatory protein P-II 1
MKKKLQAIVKPENFHFVKQALLEVGIYRMIIDEVRVYDPHNATKLQYRGSALIVDLVPKIRIEVVVREASVPAVVEAVRRANPLKRGDPEEMVLMDFEDIRRIHTRQPEHQTN